MSGGYISCGDFRGEDKSGSDVTYVLEDLPDLLPPESQEAFRLEFIQPLLDECEEYEECFIIPPETCENILPAIRILFDKYREKFGDMSVDDVRDADYESGIDSAFPKKGEFTGQKYYALIDLLKAAEISIETKKPISISFD